ncbi:hypothetical protein [Pelagicoccus sp. SDUM812005]|uniref:hypothetical protein n=1 Tax=Pelagicoccus sp. SDUM812005 TaxID=3041257 RepID=UPI00280FA062|nr:hypothetical protein [Pelagicoccus sp. SDUM812005]MDQ8181878.1 hypothetical protein [Pelagicoccus sp. SDUM812005]
MHPSLVESIPLSPWDETIQALERRIATPQYSGKTLATYRHWTRSFRDFLEEKDPAR